MNFKIPALVILIVSIYQCSDKIRVTRSPICGISFVIVVLIRLYKLSFDEET